MSMHASFALRGKGNDATGFPARGAAREHEGKVEHICRQLRAHVGARPLSLHKTAVSHQVPKARDARCDDLKLDVSALDQVLEIDLDARTCTVEPGVTFADLVRTTLPHGLVPVVVPELRSITAGGAIAGCSLESMSFRFGGFHDSCLAYEVITAGGEVLHCTPTNENALVFGMMHGSFGTLGILSKITFQLVPARPFVHVEYATHADLPSYLASIREHATRGDVDFMDGILHAPDRLVLSTGRFVDEAPYTNRYDWMKVYYRSTATRREDFLQTPQYFFRYDHGVTNVHPRSAVGRFFFGKLLHSDRLLRLAERFHRLLPTEQPDVTLDVFLPIDKAEAFLRWYRERIDFFPLWCVPYRMPRRYPWIADGFMPEEQGGLFVDLAIYGFTQKPGRNYYAEIEEALLAIGGIKTLISHNFYDRETFWKIWNKPNYDAVKERTDPDNVFRDLYTKTCRASQGSSE